MLGRDPASPTVPWDLVCDRETRVLCLRGGSLCDGWPQWCVAVMVCDPECVRLGVNCCQETVTPSARGSECDRTSQKGCGCQCSCAGDNLHMRGLM